MHSIIIICGPHASGKTTLARLLTFNGTAGVILDISPTPDFTPTHIRGLEFCPLVVITCHSVEAAVQYCPDLIKSRHPKVFRLTPI